MHSRANTHREADRTIDGWMRQPSEGQRVTRELRAVITAAGRRRDCRGSLVMGASHEALIRSQFIPSWYRNLSVSSALLPSVGPVCSFTWTTRKSWNHSCKKKHHGGDHSTDFSLKCYGNDWRFCYTDKMRYIYGCLSEKKHILHKCNDSNLWQNIK